MISDPAGAEMGRSGREPDPRRFAESQQSGLEARLSKLIGLPIPALLNYFTIADEAASGHPNWRARHLGFTDFQKAQAEKAQWEAAKDGAQQVRLVAGPGTGKSSTIERRVAHLLNSGANPKKVFTISFTRAKTANALMQESESYESVDKFFPRRR